MPRRHPFAFFIVLSFGASGLLAYYIWRQASTGDALDAWVIAINIVTAVMYIYDKLIAGSGLTRVPEFDLLLLAAFGGWIAGGLCILFLRHKINKPMFVGLFLMCVIISFKLRDAYYQLVLHSL